ncbi:glutathione S-transferase [Stipitochalara longipes BDJ]|nr:glutathione S-transferase [Stipitochalara longipes BDJ]
MASKVQITLHWLDRSRAQRIIWLLEELRLQYRLTTYKRLPDQQAPASLKAVHPLGKSPVLELTNLRTKKSLVLAESANIVEYLAEHFGSHLIPDKWREDSKGEVGDETDEWLRYKYYMNYSEGSLMALIGTGALKNGIKNAPVPFFIKPLTSRIAGMLESAYLNHNYDSHFSFLESEMSNVSAALPQEQSGGSPKEGPFVCGPKLTAVDFMMAFPLEAAQQIAGLNQEKYPLLTDYLKRVQSREAYQRAIERIIKETGKYDPGI